jgi:hypothetical protein
MKFQFFCCETVDATGGASILIFLSSTVSLSSILLCITEDWKGLQSQLRERIRSLMCRS